MSLRSLEGALVVAPLISLLPMAVLAGPATFDHSAFDALLRRNVTNGLVDYASIGAARPFRAYLDALARTDPAGLPDAERLAFWINAYNAHTIALVHARGETRSIRNIPSGDGGPPGPWRLPLASIGGRRYSLDQIEHEAIRPAFREPRIHFALVCAARGCPPLRPEAYTGDRLAAQLDAQARAFLLESPERNRVDVAARTVHLSPIFDWYREDFGGDDASLLRYVAGFHPDGPARTLLRSGQATIAWTDYDWSLNARPPGDEP